MADTAIRCEGLGKEYHVARERTRYRTLGETLRKRGRATLLRAGEMVAGRHRLGSGEEDTFWALKDLSFEVRVGEVMGIIGRNGAGKSTLLKVLSRITEPTTGWARIDGRVGSLLEVGTGFHPELTGKENTYLNGAILGMRRREIDRKFDEIVAFAEVERFIHTPVKHYSSGMYLRLAFAVAAHLEPEILIVDEVLAVGDAAFQKRCLNKMQDVGRTGRTVLFVSHSMPAVTRLCDRVLLIDGGQVVADGPPAEVVSRYLSSDAGTTALREWEPGGAPGSEIVRLCAARVLNEAGEPTDAHDIRRPVGVELEYEVLRPGYSLLPHFTLTTYDGVHAFTALDQDPEWRGRPRPVGRYRSTGWIPGNLLAEGTQIVGVAMRTVEPDLLHFYLPDALAFQVIDAPGADTARGDWTQAIPGVVRPLLRWTTVREEASRPGSPAAAVAARGASVLASATPSEAP